MERSAPKVASGRATWRCSIDKEDELAREYLRSKEPATLYGTRVNEAAMEMHNGAGDGLGRDGPKGLGARVAMEALDRVVRSHSEFKLEVLSESGGLKGGSGSGAKRFYKPGERARREASTREGGGGVGGRGGGRGDAGRLGRGAGGRLKRGSCGGGARPDGRTGERAQSAPRSGQSRFCLHHFRTHPACRCRRSAHADTGDRLLIF
mmetsp:Transcript_21286/g.66633  ORF Transcript_21286/g.66633 Transcript_21286/m.66633 type:complete len:207 (-) Transcript_21286:17-637(-)